MFRLTDVKTKKFELITALYNRNINLKLSKKLINLLIFLILESDDDFVVINATHKKMAKTIGVEMITIASYFKKLITEGLILRGGLHNNPLYNLKPLLDLKR